jgi:hypothetical protein
MAPLAWLPWGRQVDLDGRAEPPTGENTSRCNPARLTSRSSIARTAFAGSASQAARWSRLASRSLSSLSIGAMAADPALQTNF